MHIHHLKNWTNTKERSEFLESLVGKELLFKDRIEGGAFNVGYLSGDHGEIIQFRSSHPSIMFTGTWYYPWWSVMIAEKPIAEKP